MLFGIDWFVAWQSESKMMVAKLNRSGRNTRFL
jgi:hypothetical protein